MDVLGWIALGVGVALLVYLVFALVHAERF
ncbi:MAG: K(+)-transporting ATPase subunit F [Actinomycetota bacterium]|nr:K(+)-transporting ATPase subunit F [Actinomycetota bacterium]